MYDDLMKQAKYCEKTSPLYAILFETLAGYWQARRDGQCDPDLLAFFETIETCWQGRNFIAWFERPLLLAGALHEQALQGNAPRLGKFYASCGGHFERSQSAEFAEAIKTTLHTCHHGMIPFLSQQIIQTNEASRGLTWLLPLLAHWRKERPLATLIELGCSAGLGLVADQYGYQVALPDGGEWQQDGTPGFALKLTGKGAREAQNWLDDMPALGKAITARIGCDLRTLDCRNKDQSRILEALIWPDNTPRLQRLRDAMKTQRHSPLRFEDGDMVTCVERLVKEVFDTPVICLFNTIATCYLDDAHYARLRTAMAAAFHGPWATKDCLWIEFEQPRAGEDLPEFAKEAECLIRIHSRNGQSGLATQYFGSAAAHPVEIMLF